MHTRSTDTSARPKAVPRRIRWRVAPRALANSRKTREREQGNPKMENRKWERGYVHKRQQRKNEHEKRNYLHKKMLRKNNLYQSVQTRTGWYVSVRLGTQWVPPVRRGSVRYSPERLLFIDSMFRRSIIAPAQKSAEATGGFRSRHCRLLQDRPDGQSPSSPVIQEAV